MSDDIGRPVRPHVTPTCYCSICGASEDEVDEMYLGNERMLVCSNCVKQSKGRECGLKSGSRTDQ